MHFMKHGLMAACLIAQALPAAAGGGVALDHEGNDRAIIVESHDSNSRITSRGNGGALDAVIGHSSGIDIYHLGGKSEAVVDVYGSVGTVVAVGHCPAGTNPEPIEAYSMEGGVVIPRCR